MDVLAVLEQATYTLSLPDNNTPNDQLSIPALREARAAVAELFEAGDEYLSILDWLATKTAPVLPEEFAAADANKGRLRAALRDCGVKP